MQDFNRNYDSVGEMEGRFAIFKQNLKLIDERNAKGTTMKHGINLHSDLTPEQFRSQRLGRTQPGNWSTMGRKPAFKQSWDEVRASTDSVDWCAVGACTPVKDQGHCGSCWAFGGTEMLESDYFLRFGTLYELSTQEPTSCDFYDGGCGGGNAVNEWAWVNSVGGITTADVYPYDSGTTQCSGICESALEDPQYMKVGLWCILLRNVTISNSALARVSHWMNCARQRFHQSWPPQLASVWITEGATDALRAYRPTWTG